MFLLGATIALAAQTAEPPPQSYRAIGASPLWQAAIHGEFMTFETPGRDRLTVPTPARQETELGYAHGTSDFSISVEHGECTDALNGWTYPDRVTVQAGEDRYEGCGGDPLGANVPAGYGAAGGEPFWSLEIADGRLYFGVNEYVVMVPAPAPQVTGDGSSRRYTAPGISVLLKREDCELEDERVYADAVTVTAGAWTVQGCGGQVIREAPQ
ncbi:MAG TPA: hypothetical protein VEX35_13310 [Allosphingosinicella sp.]|nr:hypothetical protein [Allosphingosinicella sp.]